jgi:excisionase family DNA binding protein
MSDNQLELLSVSQAAAELNISRWRINQFINEGRLPAFKVGRNYVIRKIDLEIVRERKAGRPPAKKSDKE